VQPAKLIACLCVIIALSWTGGAHARPLVVAANPQPPFKYEEAGQLLGIDTEIIRRVLEELGIAHEILLITSDQRLQVEAKAGRIDVLLLYSENEERRAYLDYPDESYIDLTWNFFIRAADKGKFNFETYDDLMHLRIGATRGVSYTPEFWDAGLQLDLVSENTLQIEKLLAGRIDTVPMNTISTLHRAHVDGYLGELAVLPKPMKSKAYFNVFSKASTHPDMARLKANYDRIIQDLKTGGHIQEIMSRYIGSSS